MGQILLASAAGIFLMMGTLHCMWTLRDLVHPRYFTPTDETVRIAMQGARLTFNPRANVWQAWLGFNLSHSLGLVVFGGVLLAFALRDFTVFAASGLAQAGAVVVAGTYFVLAIRFWFWGPALGSGIAVLCILAALLVA